MSKKLKTKLKKITKSCKKNKIICLGTFVSLVFIVSGSFYYLDNSPTKISSDKLAISLDSFGKYSGTNNNKDGISLSACASSTYYSCTGTYNAQCTASTTCTVCHTSQPCTLGQLSPWCAEGTCADACAYLEGRITNCCTGSETNACNPAHLSQGGNYNTDCCTPSNPGCRTVTCIGRTCSNGCVDGLPGTYAGTCSGHATHCAGETWADDCGNNVCTGGTKTGVCSDQSLQCIGVTWNDSCGQPTCHGTRVCTGSCTGSMPVNAEYCTNDNAGVTSDTAITLVPSCTPSTKCEAVCKAGYTYDAVTRTCVSQTCSPQSYYCGAQTPGLIVSQTFCGAGGVNWVCNAGGSVTSLGTSCTQSELSCYGCASGSCQVTHGAGGGSYTTCAGVTCSCEPDSTCGGTRANTCTYNKCSDSCGNQYDGQKDCSTPCTCSNEEDHCPGDTWANSCGQAGACSGGTKSCPGSSNKPWIEVAP